MCLAATSKADEINFDCDVSAYLDYDCIYEYCSRCTIKAENEQLKAQIELLKKVTCACVEAI